VTTRQGHGGAGTSVPAPAGVRKGVRAAGGAVAGFLAALVLLALSLFSAAPASAHGGPFQLSIAPDGAGGLSVSASYVEDGHAVTGIIDPVATAVSPDGTTAGPVALISSAEGEGVWVTPEPFLGEGQWVVTVTTTTPESVTSTLDVTVAPIAPPVQPGESIVAEDGAAAGEAGASGGASGSSDRASGSGSATAEQAGSEQAGSEQAAEGASASGEVSGVAVALWIGVGVVVIAALVVGALVWRRRAATGR